MLLWMMMGVAQAESWCASALIAHEWGVQVIREDAPPEPSALPSWLHHTAPDAPAAVAEPVRDLPPDSGIRELPIIQFYAPRVWGDEIPLAVEVGFTEGQASTWFPQVDRLIPASEANSPDAAAERDALLADRAARQPYEASGPARGPDPTRQLGWDDLTLQRSQPAETLLHEAELDWVAALRAQPRALWVARGDERERFLFYEADTSETSDLVITRTPSGLVARNRGDWDVHDVMIVSGGRLWQAPRIPAGAAAALGRDVPLDADAVRAQLQQRWTDADQPEAPQEMQWDWDKCVMMRDPAVPVEEAAGHRLYAAEVEAMLSFWAPRLLDGQGTRVIYREDIAALDAKMPVSLYTDMYHFFLWRRLGLVVVEGVVLP